MSAMRGTYDRDAEILNRVGLVLAYLRARRAIGAHMPPPAGAIFDNCSR